MWENVTYRYHKTCLVAVLVLKTSCQILVIHDHCDSKSPSYDIIRTKFAAPCCFVSFRDWLRFVTRHSDTEMSVQWAVRKVSDQINWATTLLTAVVQGFAGSGLCSYAVFQEIYSASGNGSLTARPATVYWASSHVVFPKKFILILSLHLSIPRLPKWFIYLPYFEQKFVRISRFSTFLLQSCVPRVFVSGLLFEE